MISKISYLGSPHIGIFIAMNDDTALVPRNCPKRIESIVRKLDVEVVKTSIAKTGLFGIFCALNNQMIIVPDILEKEELKTLKDYFPEVLVLHEKYTALGNLIAMNDKGVGCPSFLKKEVRGAVNLRVAGSDLVGSSLFVNNYGFLSHPDSTPSELRSFEKVFKVKGDVGTVNFGDPYVKSGIVGNEKGVLVGELTSGPELNRIDDIFILR